MPCPGRGSVSTARNDRVKASQGGLQSMAELDKFFNLMMEVGASDLHLASDSQPIVRVRGEMERIDHPPLANDALKRMLYEIAPESKVKIFEESGDIDFGYEIP